ncbi:MAG: hypothetical protein ACI39U_04200 [Candidatus Cryptobacteroides sp.]
MVINKEDNTMKTRALFYSALALLAIACTKEQLVEDNENNNEGQNSEVNYTSFELYATIEGSKTELGENGKVNWLPGDAISIFDTATSTNTKFTTTGNGWFTSEAEVPESETYYALYWYRSAASWKSDLKVMQSKLFPDQIAKVGSFGDEVPYMAGKVDLENKRIEFKNICSHIGFTLSEELAGEGVKSLTLMGNNSETLCGTMQISIDDEGNPVVNVTDPDIYVRLHNNGKDLAAGTYYFSIVPQTFSAGFTVIVSKADGSQVAVKTGKTITEVSTRNSILPMSAPSAESYKAHQNYFVQYLDGFDIAVGDPEKGGYKFNNATHKRGNMLHDGKTNKTISADGVYFIDNNSSEINVSYNDLDSLIICAVDTESKAAITSTKVLRPKTNKSGILLFENVILTSTSADVIQQQKASDTPGTSFGYIVFDNCILKDLPRHVVYIINAATEINTISISNCDYSTKSTTSSFITFASQESTLTNVYAYNNVFYFSGSSETPMTDFKILNIQAGTVDNVIIQNNTFAKTTIPNAGLVVAGKVSKTGIVNYNLFDEVVIGTLVEGKAQHSTLVNLKFDTDSTTDGVQPYYAESVNITYNYYYSKFAIQEGTKYYLNKGNLTGSTSSSVGTPVILSQTPLSGTWDPANGAYGPYTITPVDSSKDPGSTVIGAVRLDTVPEANTASYRYSPNELGSF